MGQTIQSYFLKSAFTVANQAKEKENKISTVIDYVHQLLLHIYVYLYVYVYAYGHTYMHA